tara:strand:- start:300 stop:911 length:612 start_codon:yes stop_codon:yes gene_type:complete
MSATLNTTNIKHGSSGSNNIVLNSNGSTTIGGLTLPTSDGTNGQIIKTNGSGALSFADDQGGKILQFQYKRGGVTTNSSSGGWTDSVESGHNVNITPTKSDSILYVHLYNVGGNYQSGRSYFLRLRRKINNTDDTNVANFQTGDGSNGGMESQSLIHVDTGPTGGWNTSHVVNYRTRFGQDGSGTARYGYATTPVLVVFEIAA